MRTLSLICVVGLSVCTNPQPLDPSIEVPLDEPFVLQVNQWAEIGGTPLRLRFDEVREDSRCPADVQCFWAGNARVRLTSLLAGDVQTVDLNTELEPRELPVGEYVVHLEGLQPETRTSRQIRPEEYLANLRVSSGR